jgi:hydroxyacylglutathione hydrolase
VTETHIHADYLSGTRELARRVGATAYLSDEGDADWKYGWANEPNVKRVRNGDAIRAGRVRLDVLATPGHTPEHVSFVVTDEAASPEPIGVLTGDFVFAGDVGRPDLLERAADMKGTMEKGARTLYASLARFRDAFPGHLLLWPGHGPGSACGKNLGGLPATSLAYEKLTNWGVRAASEAEFVREVLAGPAEPPVYFKHMKRMNKEGPRSSVDSASRRGSTTPSCRRDSRAVTSSWTRARRWTCWRARSRARSRSRWAAASRPGRAGCCRTTSPSRCSRRTPRVRSPRCVSWR